MTDFEKFKQQIVKSSQSRKPVVTNSLTTESIFRALKKDKILDRHISRSLFRRIVRECNLLLAEKFLQGDDIIFPFNMGRVELRKYKPTVKFQDGKLKNGMPVDWEATIKLWQEDEDCLQSKQLVRRNEKEVFKIVYNKSRSDYNNKTYYYFRINRDLKRSLKSKIKNREIDAFKFKEK